MSDFRIQWLWFDFWVGVFVDTRKRRVYVCPLPCVVLSWRYRKRAPIGVRLYAWLENAESWDENGYRTTVRNRLIRRALGALNAARAAWCIAFDWSDTDACFRRDDALLRLKGLVCIALGRVDAVREGVLVDHVRVGYFDLPGSRYASVEVGWGLWRNWSVEIEEDYDDWGYP